MNLQRALPAAPSHAGKHIIAPAQTADARVPATWLRVAFLLFFALVLPGCSELPPGKTEIRAVTYEATKAIRNAAGRGTPITAKAEPVSFIDRLLQHPGAEQIAASVHDSKQAEALAKELAQIGAQHGLSVSRTRSANAVQMDFSEIGIRTHRIRLQFPEQTEPAAQLQPALAGGAKLAIIVDDMGSNRDEADALLGLPVPLTLSVLPDLPYSRQVADETASRGDQVMLHLPMEPESVSAPSQPLELRSGMNDQQVRTTLAHMLESVPHVSGVNNHEGSKATSDPQLMEDLMPALRQRGLFFIDSRTSASTVAFRTAQRFGVRSASRQVFLDDTETHEAISRQLELAVADAKRDGFAIAIGHPHAETISVLRQELPRLQERGVQLVFASQLAR